VPIIPTVGRRSPKIIAVIALIYVLLIAGGVTMVYPFLVTLSSAMSNDYDYERFGFYPRYVFDAEERYLKYLAEKYFQPDQPVAFTSFQAAYGLPAHWGSFREIAFDESAIGRFDLFGAEKEPERWERIRRRAADYEAFVRETASTRGTTENMMALFLFDNDRSFQKFTRDRYLDIARRAEGAGFDELRGKEQIKVALTQLRIHRSETYPSFEYMQVSRHNFPFALPKWVLPLNIQNVDYIDWVTLLDPVEKIPITRHQLWTNFLFESGIEARRKASGRGEVGTAVADDKARTFNEMAGTDFDSIWQAPFPEGEVGDEDLARLRQEFLEEKWPVRLTQLTNLDRAPFKEYFDEHFPTIGAFNTTYETSFRSFDDIPLTATLPVLADVETAPVELADRITVTKALRSLWRNYVLTRPLEERRMLAPETQFQEWLGSKYSGEREILDTYEVASIADIRIPIPEMDRVHYVSNMGRLFRSFMGRNFKRAFFFVAIRGRALFNTMVLVSLTILTTLTVNPLAAYALSRFQLRATNQILIFLLATMAFPPAVSMIPAFLLLRDLRLLNTFFALVLPGAANGFSIFLLKGFFDSLPKELYEAASIDGASELGMFTTITLPLCKPILAVIALGAFISAYGGFMWAFLACQDERMWTIMVWLYQFQQMYSKFPYVVMAALVIASLPTFLIFLTCQKIILRGIIIPSMK